ncbi:hypothetical protein ACEWY4_027414 [Coilia grayii]|uniref:Reverse transcriptase domain-containing protein n=1 Tax=Coilia grayii TaxID=363190 RepID=A0ABD1IPS9_9TELE
MAQKIMSKLNFICAMISMYTQVFYFLLIMGEIRVGSLNVNGARERSKRAVLFDAIRHNRLDVVFLQETHSDSRNTADWAREFDGLSLLSHNLSNSGGVAILFSRSFTPRSYQVEEIIKGRLLKVKALFENACFVFICIYAPTVAIDRMLFLNSLLSVLQSCDSDEFLLLGGDFNCTVSALDRNHIEPHMPSRKRLIELLISTDLVDIWRNFHGCQKQYTWVHPYNNMLSLARLDRFYGFKHQLSSRSCSIIPVGFSDHSLVVCCLSFRFVKPTSAYWHFNVNLLSDSNFKDVFRHFWNYFRTMIPSFQSLQQWWDFGKVQIKQLCQEYTLNVTRDITRTIKTLEREIIELQVLAENTGTPNLTENLKIKKNLLAELLGISAQGALVRSRFQSVELMDAPSKFFFNLEKKNGQLRFIHALRSETGILLTDHASIRNRAVHFYKELYKSEISQSQVDDTAFFDALPQVSTEANAKLGRALTMEELESALQDMECGKAPGVDGLPVDFFKSFWPEMGKDLLAVLSDSLAKGRLPLSCRRAVLTLLPKKGDLNEITSWRPVSILCSDYKLLSKVLANRLSKVLEQVIHPDQTYCVPGRLIYNNISFIRDIFSLSKTFNLEFGLISIDQEKAFDRVEHSYLWSVLSAFGFNSSFIDMIRVLYSDVESMLKVNGDLCTPFKIQRGVRQGCALSGMLYVLAIEPLLIKLRQELQGLTVPVNGISFQLSAYADDISILVKDERDIHAMMKLFKDFRVLSSSKVNWCKSVAVLFGKWSGGEPSLPDGLSWTRKGIKYLGVYLGDETWLQKNFEGAVEKVKGRLNKWKFLFNKLSYRGRVLIINNLAASSLWHRLACVDPPAQLLSKIQSILVDFFWDSLHWVPQSVLYLPKEEGGQGLVHLQSRTAAFRLQFVQRLLSGPVDSGWKSVACSILQTVGQGGMDKTLFLMNPNALNFNGLPVFYRNLFKVWSLLTVHRQSTNSLYWFLKEPLIYGSLFDLALDKPLPCLTLNLLRSGVTTLGALVKIAGSDFKNFVKLADYLGTRSYRIVSQLLGKWRARLTKAEFAMLEDFSAGSSSPDCNDPFPNLALSPNLMGCAGTFLECDKLSFLDPPSNGKSLYKMCVKSFNRKSLDKRSDTPWRSVLNLKENVKPEWRVLHKSPLTKKCGDLQWKILHGVVAVNAFVSVLNPEVGQECPFCSLRETIFHAFLHCVRLRPLFTVLRLLFISLNEQFSFMSFICGTKYVQKRRNKCQLLNFLLGQAKMAIYVSRRNKIEKGASEDIVVIFSILVRSRLLIDFRFYKLMKNLDTFEEIWCHNGALCSVKNDELLFAHVLSPG